MSKRRVVPAVPHVVTLEDGAKTVSFPVVEGVKYTPEVRPDGLVEVRASARDGFVLADGFPTVFVLKLS